MQRWFHHSNDHRVLFDERYHRYRIAGTANVAVKNVTDVVSRFFRPFNADVAINIPKWRSLPPESNPYSQLIERAEAAARDCCVVESTSLPPLDDSFIADVIKTGWAAKGTAAANLGTAMHAAFAKILMTPGSLPKLAATDRADIVGRDDLSSSSKQTTAVSDDGGGNTDSLHSAVVEAFGWIPHDTAALINRAIRARDRTLLAEARSRSSPYMKVLEMTTVATRNELTALSDWGAIHPNLTPVQVEYAVFAPFADDLIVAGRLDALFYDETAGNYVIVDWKRSDPTSASVAFGGTRSLAPFSKHLDDSKVSRFKLQLALYAWILERNYGIVVNEGIIVFIHPDRESFFDVRIVKPSVLVADAAVIAAIRSAVMVLPSSSPGGGGAAANIS